jgi:hypothetical protein
LGAALPVVGRGLTLVQAGDWISPFESFDRETIGSTVICTKPLSFFGHLVRSKIDFGRFAPMFQCNAALDRNAIP